MPPPQCAVCKPHKNLCKADASKTSGAARGANSRLARVLYWQNTGGRRIVVSVKPIAAALRARRALRTVEKYNNVL